MWTASTIQGNNLAVFVWERERVKSEQCKFSLQNELWFFRQRSRFKGPVAMQHNSWFGWAKQQQQMGMTYHDHHKSSLEIARLIIWVAASDFIMRMQTHFQARPMRLVDGGLTSGDQNITLNQRNKSHFWANANWGFVAGARASRI